MQESITDTMAVCIDAEKVPTHANENVDDADAKSYECQYRDAKVATVSAVPMALLPQLNQTVARLVPHELP